MKFTADGIIHGEELHNSCRSCVEVFSTCAGSLLHQACVILHCCHIRSAFRLIICEKDGEKYRKGNIQKLMEMP